MPPDDEVQQFAQVVPDIEPTPGGRSTFTTEQFRLSHEAEKARGSAMELLGKALNNQPEITPSQGFAAALLGAIPTIGGYMLGNAVGRPNIPQGTYFKGVSPEQFNLEFGRSGANYGGQQGAQIGNEAAQGYFNSREEEVKQRIPIFAKQAAIEEDRATQLDQQAQTMNLHGLDDIEADNRQNQAFQNEKALIPLREQSAINIANSKTTAQKILEQELSDPSKKASFDRVSMGKGLESDFHNLSAAAQKEAAANMRSVAYGQSVNNAQSRFNTLQSYAEDADTVATSPLGKDPKLNAQRAKIMAERNQGAYAVNELANSYDHTNGAFLGIDRAKEAALASTIYHVARAAAGTGAQFSGNEKPLVDAASAPQMDINGYVDFLHTYLTKGGDPAEIVRTIGSVMDKSFNAQLKGYGREFKTYASAGPPGQADGAGGTSPKPKMSFQEYQKRKAEGTL